MPDLRGFKLILIILQHHPAHYSSPRILQGSFPHAVSLSCTWACLMTSRDQVDADATTTLTYHFPANLTPHAHFQPPNLCWTDRDRTHYTFCNASEAYNTRKPQIFRRRILVGDPAAVRASNTSRNCEYLSPDFQSQARIARRSWI
jgi:hypothetical protein